MATFSDTLQNSPFSTPFKTLYYLGAWAPKPLSSRKLILYFIYQVTITFLCFCGIFSLIFDLYLVSGNFEKVTYNLCVTTLFAGGVIRNINLYTHHRIIGEMRLQLHEDMYFRTDPESEIIHQEAEKEFRTIRILFYSTLSILAPFWVGARYMISMMKERVLPAPLRLPFDWRNDDVFNYVFGLVSLVSFLGLIFVIETEMVMLCFLIQISREYHVLVQDIHKMNDLYKTFSKETQVAEEFNSSLRRTETKSYLTKFASRQRKIIGYTKNFEACYSKIMLLEIFVVSLLMIVSAIQCLMMSETSLVDLSYQMGYLACIIFDTFLVCWFANRIMDECYDVGVALYSTNWYQMDVELQKNIILIMIRAQNPPRLTAGGAIGLNANAFMNVMKNIYGWITLFRQLEIR